METKLCQPCNRILPLSSFGLTQGKPKTYCKECCVTKQKAFYKRTRETRLKVMREYGKKNRATLQPKDTARMQKRRVHHKYALMDFLGNKCVCCGYEGCREAFDFHHIDESTKSFDIAKFTWKSLEILKEEAKKCVLVCARCHRELHAGFRKL